MKKAFFLFLVIFSLFTNCSAPSKNEVVNEGGKTVAILHAKGFSIVDYGDKVIVEVKNPYPGAEESTYHTLRRHGALQPGEIKIPIQNIVCTSTTHLPLLELLGRADHLSGFPGLKYISSDTFIKLASEGKVKELGVDTQLNVEAILDLQPDLVMAFSMGNESRQLTKLTEMGVTVAFNGDYLEENVLGRAEWIKFMGAFFDQLDEADRVFTTLEGEYNALVDLTASVTNRPTVMSGVLYGDAWYLPGGKNWGATLIADAGGHYLWQDDPSTGWLEVGFENVIEKAKEADFWIGVASISSLAELSAADDRYPFFAPYQNKKVFNYTAKIGPGGGYAIMESGYAMPHVVLADMIYILHPDLLPNHKLYFYEQLQ